MQIRRKYRVGALIFAALMLVPGLSACTVQEDGNTPETEDSTVQELVAKEYSQSGLATGTPADGTPMSDAFVRHTADFGLSMLQQQKAGENVMLSPLSLLYALGMTANGAAGNTLSQMEQVLFGETDVDTASRYFLDYTSNLPDGSEGVSLKIANSIWLNQRMAQFSVNTEFLAKNATYYGAAVYGRDFAHPDTLPAVNGWVSDNTDGMIPQILQSLTGEELMLLINTVLFDGKWAETYSEDDIREGTFTAYDGTVQEGIDYLCSTESGYFTLGEGKGFVRPYAERYNFVGILPDEGVDVYEYVKSIDGAALMDAMADYKWEKTYVRIPEFSFDSTPVIKSALKELGMTDAFDPALADLSRLGEVEGADAYLSDVIQKTRIEVTRDGTKAAAATVVIVTPTSAAPDAQIPVRIYLDRPFVFAITDSETGLLLFCGIVTGVA